MADGYPKRSCVPEDNEGNVLYDTYSKALKTIETEHFRIHAGQGFALSGTITGLAAGASTYLHVDPLTPIHFRYYKFAANGGPFDVGLYENPVVNVQGTAELTPRNRNRLSSTVSATKIYTGTTFSSDGTRLDLDRAISTGTGAHAASEIEGVAVEWILDGGNTYALKITNNDNGAINLVYRFFWYEL